MTLAGHLNLVMMPVFFLPCDEKWWPTRLDAAIGWRHRVNQACMKNRACCDCADMSVKKGRKAERARKGKVPAPLCARAFNGSEIIISINLRLFQSDGIKPVFFSFRTASYINHSPGVAGNTWTLPPFLAFVGFDLSLMILMVSFQPRTATGLMDHPKHVLFFPLGERKKTEC